MKTCSIISVEHGLEASLFGTILDLPLVTCEDSLLWQV